MSSLNAKERYRHRPSDSCDFMTFTTILPRASVKDLVGDNVADIAALKVPPELKSFHKLNLCNCPWFRREDYFCVGSSRPVLVEHVRRPNFPSRGNGLGKSNQRLLRCSLALSCNFWSWLIYKRFHCLTCLVQIDFIFFNFFFSVREKLKIFIHKLYFCKWLAGGFFSRFVHSFLYQIK